METIQTALLDTLGILNLKQNTALVEAGHIHAGEEINSEHEVSLMIGQSVFSALTELDMSVSMMLFVDDYNGAGDREKTISDYGRYLSSSGFIPDEVVFESELTAGAETLLCNLKEKGKTKEHKGNLVYPCGSRGLISLIRGGRYTCQLLDAALYVAKNEKADGGLLVTVLPAFYKEEQEKTKAILEACGYSFPILDVYFDQKGKIEVDFPY